MSIKDVGGKTEGCSGWGALTASEAYTLNLRKYVSGEQQKVVGVRMRGKSSTGSKHTWLRNRSWSLCAYPPGVSFVLLPDWRKSYSMDLLYCQNKISLPVLQTQDLGLKKRADCLFFQILKWPHWNKHCLTNKSKNQTGAFVICSFHEPVKYKMNVMWVYKHIYYLTF